MWPCVLLARALRLCVERQQRASAQQCQWATASEVDSHASTPAGGARQSIERAAPVRRTRQSFLKLFGCLIGLVPFEQQVSELFSRRDDRARRNGQFLYRVLFVRSIAKQALRVVRPPFRLRQPRYGFLRLNPYLL